MMCGTSEGPLGSSRSFLVLLVIKQVPCQGYKNVAVTGIVIERFEAFYGKGKVANCITYQE